MDKVYQLYHKRRVMDDELVFTTVLIGFYSSQIKAEETIERYKKIQGFKDFPDDFITEEYEVDDDDIEFE